MKDIKKKLVKQVKRSRPSLAEEIKDMPMKDFRALWFVVQQGLKLKKKNKKKNKSTSPQAGGPAHKESGFKRPSLTGCKL